VADWPEAASADWFASALSIPAAAGAKSAALAADLLSDVPAKRQAAAVQLGTLGAKESAPALRMLSSDADPAVRRAAIAALAVVLGRDADDDVEKATRDADASVRRVALDLLATSDPKRAAKRAGEMKDDPDAGVRARAAALARPTK
jgi:HEAT repeat protein